MMGQTCHWNLTSADLKNAMRLAWFNLLSLAKSQKPFLSTIDFKQDEIANN